MGTYNENEEKNRDQTYDTLKNIGTNQAKKFAKNKLQNTIVQNKDSVQITPHLKHTTPINKDASKLGKSAMTTAASTATGGTAAIAKAATDAAKKSMEAIQQMVAKSSTDYVQETTRKNSVSENAPQITVAVIVAPFIVIVFVVVMIMYSTITLTVAPVMALYNGINSAWDRVSSFGSETGKDTATYLEVTEHVKGMLNKSFEDSYLKTCYREIIQIVREKNYDLEYTLESYNETEYPYIHNGEFCNINYAELLGIMSLTETFDYEHFNYDTFKKMLSDQEFLRCLYDLDVIETEGIKAIHTPQGASVVKHSRQRISFIFEEDGRVETYDVSNPGPYCKKVIYGEIRIYEYVLKKLYDYFGVDPYAKNNKIPTLSNHQLLSTYDSTSRVYQDVDWGDAERTQILDYKKFTGVITDTSENIFAKDIHKDPILSETKVYLDTTEYKQGDERWGSKKYGSGTMANLGCCVTAVAIVCDYFNDDMTITPETILNHINMKYMGKLYNEATVKDFGIPVYNKTQDVNVKTMIGELKNERLIIAHIAPYQKGTKKYGHYVVINGYEAIGNEGFFYVTEPASRLDKTVSLAEAAMIFDSYVSYGKY